MIVALAGCGATGPREGEGEKPGPPKPPPVLSVDDLARAGREAGADLAALASARPALADVAVARLPFRVEIPWPALAPRNGELVLDSLSEQVAFSLPRVELAPVTSRMLVSRVTVAIRLSGKQVAADYTFTFAVVEPPLPVLPPATAEAIDPGMAPLLPQPRTVLWAKVVTITKEGGRGALVPQPFSAGEIEALAREAAQDMKVGMKMLGARGARFVPGEAVAREHVGVVPSFLDRLLAALLREGIAIEDRPELPFVDAAVSYEGSSPATAAETHRFFVSLTRSGATIPVRHWERFRIKTPGGW